MQPVSVGHQELVLLAVATIAPRPSIYVHLGHLVQLQMVWLLILDPVALVDQ